MLESIMVPIAIVSAVGLIAGIILSIATIIFHKPVDEREEALREALPGVNCGACGYSGCDGYAKALAGGEAEVTLCSPGGAETRTQLSEILGVEAGDVQKKSAFVFCNGQCSYTSNKMDYTGAKTCYGANQIFGGPEACQYGCMGYGDCLSACAYDAIRIVDGVAQVDAEKCVGCLKCIKACPKNLISMLPAEGNSVVVCANHDKGGSVRKICTVGCISCSRCIKVCPSDAISLENSLAVIDPERCTNCGQCIETCPQNCIKELAIKEKVS